MTKNLAIIGTGNMALPLARYFTQAGHKITLGSRDPQRGRRVAGELEGGIQGGSIADAVEAGDIVFLAVPHMATAETLEATGPLAGKVVVDMSNCFTPDFSGLRIGHTNSAAEVLAKSIPDARVVKAFNTMFATVLRQGVAFGGRPIDVFYAGDDRDACREVAGVIRSAGFSAVNAGGLKSARFLEPLAALVVQVDNNLDHDCQLVPAMLERPRQSA